MSPKRWDAAEVEALVRAEGSQRAAARKLGITPQRVSQILGGQAYRDVANARSRRYNAKNREAGLCSCGKPPEPGYKSCPRCQGHGARSNARKKEAAKMRLRRRRWQVRVSLSVVDRQLPDDRKAPRHAAEALMIYHAEVLQVDGSAHCPLRRAPHRIELIPIELQAVPEVLEVDVVGVAAAGGRKVVHKFGRWDGQPGELVIDKQRPAVVDRLERSVQ